MVPALGEAAGVAAPDGRSVGQHPPVDPPGDRLHIPVFAERTVELLGPALSAPAAGGRPRIVVDATLGMGGHATALLQAYPHAALIGIDRDPAALRIAGHRLAEAGVLERARLVHAVFDDIGAVIAESAGAHGVDALLFDLGVSSLQLDQSERGFAYATDAPLDMRMDPTTGISAAQVLNEYSGRELARILHEYGEERFARKIAAAVVKERAKEPFTTSRRLVELLYAVIPAPARRTGGHPAKRTFQALRVEVNGELDALKVAIPAAVDGLAVGGRIVVLSYQSLEDRIVKHAIAPLTVSSAPLDLPIDLPGHEPTFRWLTRGSLTPSAQEISENPRAASARLRAATRVRKADR